LGNSHDSIETTLNSFSEKSINSTTKNKRGSEQAPEKDKLASEILTVERVAVWLKVRPEWVRAHANGNWRPRFRREDIERFLERAVIQQQSIAFRR
jgi:hypothetical protein